MGVWVICFNFKTQNSRRHHWSIFAFLSRYGYVCFSFSGRRRWQTFTSFITWLVFLGYSVLHLLQVYLWSLFCWGVTHYNTLSKCPGRAPKFHRGISTKAIFHRGLAIFHQGLAIFHRGRAVFHRGRTTIFLIYKNMAWVRLKLTGDFGC